MFYRLEGTFHTNKFTSDQCSESNTRTAQPTCLGDEEGWRQTRKVDGGGRPPTISLFYEILQVVIFV